MAEFFATDGSQVNSTISGGSDIARRLTEGKMREANQNFVFSGNANLTHEPKYFIHILNVSDREHLVERPWVHPQRLGSVIVIPACQAGQKVSNAFRIPDIVQMKHERPGHWQFYTTGADGKFLAQDALNPDDMTGNWKTTRKVNQGALTNEGTNLYNKGCFWIRSDAPAKELEAAIAKAIERMEAYYETLIEDANQFYLEGGKGILLINHTHRRAARYMFEQYGREVEWNKVFRRKIPCTLCGEPINAVAAIHRCADGHTAIIDWHRAFAGGFVTREQAAAHGLFSEQVEHMAAAADAAKPKSRRRKKQPTA